MNLRHLNWQTAGCIYSHSPHYLLIFKRWKKINKMCLLLYFNFAVVLKYRCPGYKFRSYENSVIDKKLLLFLIFILINCYREFIFKAHETILRKTAVMIVVDFPMTISDRLCSYLNNLLPTLPIILSSHSWKVHSRP